MTLGEERSKGRYRGNNDDEVNLESCPDDEIDEVPGDVSALGQDVNFVGLDHRCYAGAASRFSRIVLLG